MSREICHFTAHHQSIFLKFPRAKRKKKNILIITTSLHVQTSTQYKNTCTYKNCKCIYLYDQGDRK